MSDYRIIGVQVHWKTGAVEILTYDGARANGIHTKHLVGANLDVDRGPGISLRRYDTDEEFAWIPSGSYHSIRFTWNKALPAGLIKV